MTNRLPAICSLSLLPAFTVAAAAAPAGSDASRGVLHWSFDEKVANIELAVIPLGTQVNGAGASVPRVEGDAWFGTIPRRSAGSEISDDSRYVPFMTEYFLGNPVRAWVDSDLDGDLADESPRALNDFPGGQGARSFLADLEWSTGPAETTKVHWKLRIVLESQIDPDTPPGAKLQRVFARMGEVELEGRRHRAVLHDGNIDGLYTKEFGDGIFVDEDDDLHFEIDQMSASFGPFSTPFVMGRERYEVLDLATDGSGVTVRVLGPAEPLAAVEEGKPAPEFAITDTSERTWRLADHRGRLVLVYFWNSRCGRCQAQAGPLADLLSKVRGAGVDIVGISYDADRSEMNAFRLAHGQDWPTSFEGKAYWENSVGRLYRASGSGFIYLIDRDGTFRGRFTDLPQLAERIETLLEPPRTVSR